MSPFYLYDYACLIYHDFAQDFFDQIYGDVVLDLIFLFDGVVYVHFTLFCIHSLTPRCYVCCDAYASFYLSFYVLCLYMHF